MSEGELLLLDCLELEQWSFPAFKFELKHWLFCQYLDQNLTSAALLVLRPPDWDWNYTIGALRSLVC